MSGKKLVLAVRKKKATEKRKGSPNTKCILLKRLVHHQSYNEKSGQKSENTTQDNSTANVPYAGLIYQNLIPISTNLNLTPTPPNLSPNCYQLTLLKSCHRNVSKYYGCQALFVIDGYPKEPYDFVIVSTTQRSYVDPKTQQKTISSNFSKVYFHFNWSCVLKHDSIAVLRHKLLLYKKN